MTRLEKSAAVLLLLGFTGCQVGWFLDRTAPVAIRSAKNYFEELRQRQIDQLVQSFDPSADKGKIRQGLLQVSALVPQQEPLDVETLGASAECKGSGICSQVVSLEYKYPDRWILFQVTVDDQSGRYAITDLNLTPESMPLESMARFTLRGKGWLHYAMLFVALLSIGLTLYALALCIRTPMQKRKWLWMIVTILGIGKLGIAWFSGELWYKILHFAIFPAGWGFNTESPFIYVSLPAGAILFLLKRSRLGRADTPPPPTSTAAPTVSISGAVNGFSQ